MAFATLPLERRVTTLVFALRLRDGLTLQDQLLGSVQVTAGARAAWRKDVSGTFLFLDLPGGALTFQVRSDPNTPFYQPVDIDLTIPFGSTLWPAFPDIGLADASLPLSDPGQSAAYRTQFLQSVLRPAIAYPFDPAATLVRGVVMQGPNPVAGATVFDVPGDALSYVTGADGQFVLVYTTPPQGNANVTIRVQRGGHPDVDTSVVVSRGATTSAQINV